MCRQCWTLSKALAKAVVLSDNDGAPFQWTPNVQLISKVYLKKHQGQSRTYTLNKKDAKMVRDAMAKKITA